MHAARNKTPALAYATPVAKGPRVWAAVALLMAALGLIFLGGCFMMGIMGLNSAAIGFAPPPAPPTPKTPGQILLEIILYCVAFACFGGGLYLFILVLSWLRRIVFS